MSEKFDRREISETIERIKSGSAICGIIGLGYVGLPLAAAVARAGFSTIGIDIDRQKPDLLNRGHSYIDAVKSDELASLIKAERFYATAEFSKLSDCDVIVICVPTPLTRQREPDLSYIESTMKVIARYMKAGQLIILESTTYPGTTREVAKPILEAAGMRSEEHFLLGFSPEREDPGNRNFSTTAIPKIVSGDGPLAARAVEAFYGAVVEKVVPVSSMDTAEAVKITENVFRAVNIALVNELKVVFDRMGIDIWEVIEAAKTKPFGYMPFYPGPGLGGHCIPIDPFYLTWKSREYDIPTRFIELAGEINVAMPRFVISKLEEALDKRLSISLGSARILIIGLAYKKNVSDVRESPSFKLLDLLGQRGAKTSYHDPHVPIIPSTREHGHFAGTSSEALDESTIAKYDAVLIATDHDAVDYELIFRAARLVVDTRNAFAQRGLVSEKIVKA
jgi:UDP-N-acetyl-D-glucosamine dehydrogenase